ncbi:MAG TPA: hypothetical protein VJW17_15395 [Pyrinomonadaceae bacterium]|nr:hypothetical protein [Pyrinomonadaceae bacterium]
MSRMHSILSLIALLLASSIGNTPRSQNPPERVTKPYPNFEVAVLVDGRRLPEHYERGRIYVEATDGAEYELRLRNSTPDRVAVALFVDGLNTIDARQTSAWKASKWVIEPYQTITISGWQMSSERARRFYFTDERDSYAAKLGRKADLGVISAVFFRERGRRVVPLTRSSSDQMKAEAPAMGTGIGRSVRNDVEWIDMDLDSRPAGEVTISYKPRIHADEHGYCPEPRSFSH